MSESLFSFNVVTHICHGQGWTLTLQTNKPEGSVPDRSVLFLNYSGTKTSYRIILPGAFRDLHEVFAEVSEDSRALAGC